mgnify:CR=1 FL=1
MKTLDELYDDYSKAYERVEILLEKCKNHEPPYDGMTEDGYATGGENSTSYFALYSMMLSISTAMASIARIKKEKYPSPKYENVVKYEPIHRCRMCKYIGTIGNECICKSPRTNINAVRGGITSNMLMKFDSHWHHYLKTAPDRLACKEFKDFSYKYDINLENNYILGDENRFMNRYEFNCSYGRYNEKI